MANAWFRMYSEFAHDPKVQMLSETDQRRYIMLLCIRCNGDVTLQDEEVAFQLRISNEQWVETKRVLVSRSLVTDDNKPVAWDKRQYASDSSAERVAKHREAKKQACNVPVTPQNRTDTEQNRTDTEETTSPEKPARFNFKDALVLAGVDPNVAADYITTRKAKKCVQTETAFNLFSAESSKAGLSVADAVAICCKRGWGGFDASWIKPEDKSSVVGDGRTEYQRMSDAMLAVTGTRNFL